MSGIAGIYHRDGQPVERDGLERMTAAMAHLGPDGIGHWVEGAVGLGHAAFHTTPESLEEKQPLTDVTQDLCLVLDGRVDNREELETALAARGVWLRDATDGELILQGYACWGEAIAERIIGDFALAIWDRPRRRLFCARDPLGIRPFYYLAEGPTFRWASEIRPILADGGVPRQINEGMVAEYLADAVTDQAETLYRGVRRLPPGHALVVDADGLRTWRYWDPAPASEIRYRTDAEYAEHLAALLHEAVRCRLRSHGPVGAELSGGLDSSSVVGVAQSLRRAGLAPAGALETFSLVFPGLGCDESAWIGDVVAMWDLPWTASRPAMADGARSAACAGRTLDVPDYPNGVMLEPLWTVARSRGLRVLLTGLGGDEWLDSPNPPRGGWRRAPAAVVGRLRRALGRQGLPPWIDRGFARRVGLAERLRAGGRPRACGKEAHRGLHEGIAAGWRAHAAEMNARSDGWLGVERRHPFHDRRLVEWALAIPEEQRERGGETKRVLRRAVADLLPESVRQRRTKAEFSPIFVAALAAHGGEAAFDELRVAALGWVDAGEVRRLYRALAGRAARGDAAAPGVWPLWMIRAIELWVNVVFFDGKTVSRGHARFGRP